MTRPAFHTRDAEQAMEDALIDFFEALDKIAQKHGYTSAQIKEAVAWNYDAISDMYNEHILDQWEPVEAERTLT